MWTRNHQSSGQWEQPVSQGCPLLWKQVQPGDIGHNQGTDDNDYDDEKCNHGSSTDVTSATFSSNSNSGRIDLMSQMVEVSMIEMFKSCFYVQSLFERYTIITLCVNCINEAKLETKTTCSSEAFFITYLTTS